MVVDIEKGDTFQATDNVLWQYRDQRMRGIAKDDRNCWDRRCTCDSEAHVPRDVAFAWIRSLGHEVKHAEEPNPTTTYPVVKVRELTHGVLYCGAIGVMGTLAQCKEYVKTYEKGDESIVALDWTAI